MQKIVWMLQSRKFWAAVIGLLIASGVLQLSDAQEADLLQAILTVVTTLGYAISVALEDAGRHVGEGIIVSPVVMPAKTVDKTTQEG